MQAELFERIRTSFASLGLQEQWPADGPILPVAEHVAFARFLKEECGFTLYVTVVGSHWPGADGEGDEPGTEESFEVATVLRRPGAGSCTVSWRVKLGKDESIPTLFFLFEGADWQEREQYDLVGVVFSDHPDLRRLMMPEDWQGYPLQKVYAIDTAHAPWR